MPRCIHCNSPSLPDGHCLRCSAAVDADADGATAVEPVDPTFIPRPGARVGDFVLLEPVDRGAMGEVWRAEPAHLSTGRRDLVVAVKLMLPEIAARPELRDRFTREARAHARLEHPAIPRFYAYGEVDDRPYLVMGFVPGPTLAELLATDSPLAVDRARHIAAQLAQGLAHLHAEGIVHRDLKPANVKVVSDGDRDRVVILDLGICKALGAWDDSLETRGMLGTPLYMAPEQLADASRVEPATDQFALGGLLYEMLTGKAPFAASNAAAVLVRIQTAIPPQPSTLRTPMDRDLDRIVDRLLQKDPSARFPDMRAVAASLNTGRQPQSATVSTVMLAPGRPSWWQLVQVACGIVAAGAALTAYTVDRNGHSVAGLDSGVASPHGIVRAIDDRASPDATAVQTPTPVTVVHNASPEEFPRQLKAPSPPAAVVDTTRPLREGISKAGPASADTPQPKHSTEMTSSTDVGQKTDSRRHPTGRRPRIKLVAATPTKRGNPLPDEPDTPSVEPTYTLDAGSPPTVDETNRAGAPVDAADRPSPALQETRERLLRGAEMNAHAREEGRPGRAENDARRTVRSPNFATDMRRKLDDFASE